MTVYIEGDGASWRENLPPDDPSPLTPLALRLAARDSRSALLYLARPCQFLSAAERRDCPTKFWTTHRYGPEVEAALAGAIEQQRQRLGARRVHLVGYSGGGVMAARLAARLPEVASLVTVAAPLDVEAWTRHHGVSPLVVGGDGAQLAARLARLPQWHFAGSADRVVPPNLIQDFVRQIGPHARFELVSGEKHDCCWPERWPALLAPILATVNQKVSQP